MKKNKEYYLHYAKPEEVKELTLIHYGAKKYDSEKFYPIVNDWVKPKGGLWTSPINSTDGWKDWCNAEDFRRCSKRNSFSLKLKEWALILKIESMSHLEAIPVFHPYKDLVDKSETFRYMAYPDFEALVGLGVHAIWLTAEGQWKTRMPQFEGYRHPEGLELNLYGWDCETVLVMDKSVIVPISNTKQSSLPAS